MAQPRLENKPSHFLWEALDVDLVVWPISDLRETSKPTHRLAAGREHSALCATLVDTWQDIGGGGEIPRSGNWTTPLCLVSYLGRHLTGYWGRRGGPSQDLDTGWRKDAWQGEVKILIETYVLCSFLKQT